MRHPFSSSSVRLARPQWPAVVGAVALWGAAAAVLSPGETSLWPALAAEADAPLPATEPLRFFFPKGEARLPLPTGPYAFNQQETANSQALKRLLDLQPRLAGLPVRPVWIASSAGGATKEQLRWLSTAIVGKAVGAGVDAPALPKSDPLVVAAGDSSFDVFEYRLETVNAPQRADCAVMREVAFADMPAAVDGGPLRLKLAGATVAATPGTVWRDVPGLGRDGGPGPWRLWSAPGASGPSAGRSKEMSDYPRPWDGKLKHDATMNCEVRLVAIRE